LSRQQAVASIRAQSTALLAALLRGGYPAWARGADDATVAAGASAATPSAVWSPRRRRA
jgi:hypothetical protein